ncbi:uncharacterized protein LOC136079267 [Hydra vulgaris]|uniref:ATP-dependent DNA helicase n=1 Tax=Hydra vulgaris TaxID=6087 RepID=A0ABM4BPL5_HYDVU
MLNEEQEQIFNAILNNINVFITGSAGTGKTFAINTIYQRLCDMHKNVYVTASTGIAAKLYPSAMTVHSFFSFAHIKQSVQDVIKHMNVSTKERLTTIDILIIDEISMLSPYLLQLIHNVLCSIKKSILLFGGCLVIVGGDFYQLTPIDSPLLLFDDPFWILCQFKVIRLIKNYRQQENDKFLACLYSIRIAQWDDITFKYLRKRLHATDLHINSTYTRLFFTNAERISHNNKMLDLVHKREYVYESTVKYHNNYVPTEWPFQTPQTTKLKKGVPVLCLRNLPDYNLANGTQGTHGLVPSRNTTKWNSEKLDETIKDDYKWLAIDSSFSRSFFLESTSDPYNIIANRLIDELEAPLNK